MANTSVTYVLCAIFTVVLAIPEVTFPFNSQVPTVARVDIPYLFQFSASTFSVGPTEVTYSLSNHPAWLLLDSANRTLFGTPTQADVGVEDFVLTAADSAGARHLDCTLVVSTDPAPRLQGDVSKQLAATANLSSSDPPVVTLLPASAFTFDFEPSSFIDIVQRKLHYYATLTDHTPLPAWLKFNAQSLSFIGTAPDLSAFPQSWDVELIASDVKGFSGARATFCIAISRQQLVFVPERDTMHASVGSNVNYTALGSQLFLNGGNINAETLTSVRTELLPAWLKLDARTLAIAGTVPSDAVNERFTVTVVDAWNNTATATVEIVTTHDDSIFRGSIDMLTAYTGQEFSYRIPESLLRQPDANLSVTVPHSAAWLEYDADSNVLQGTVPLHATPTTLIATLSARVTNSPDAQYQTFSIFVKKSTSTSSTGNDNASQIPSGSTSTNNLATATAGASMPSHGRLSSGAIAAAVVCSIVGAAILIALWLLCLRRRRENRDGYVRQSAQPDKSHVSRPVPRPTANVILTRTDMHVDVEKAPAAMFKPLPMPRNSASPPRVALDLPPSDHRRKSKWMQRFSRNSQVSSLGNGEDAIRGDVNIPEWGRPSRAVQMPHDSFSVPTAMARTSQQPLNSTTQRYTGNRLPRLSDGIGIMNSDALMARHGSKRSYEKRKSGSVRRISIALCRSSQTSLNSPGTSVLSVGQADFPRPPTMGTLTTTPTSSEENVDCRTTTIRLVDRSNSVLDTRSMQEKRQSYIRNRASHSFTSPLFAHGLRDRSKNDCKSESTIGSSATICHRRKRRVRSELSTYSESSSLGVQGRPHDSRRFSAKVRSQFAPNYPRAVTRSSLEAAAEEDKDDDDNDSDWTSSLASDDQAQGNGKALAAAERQLAAEYALPRHQRNWVTPSEASPTPPPARSHRNRSTPSSLHYENYNDEKETKRPEKTRLNAKAKVHNRRHRSNPLCEPLCLVSKDSLARREKPKLVHTYSSKRSAKEKSGDDVVKNIDVEDMREDEATTGGGEITEGNDVVSLVPRPLVMGNGGVLSKTNTMSSSRSDGPAFL